MSQFFEEGIVDVEKRTKEIGKILGDPTLFPVEFLNWMKRYIEQSGITLPASSIIGGFKPGSGSVRNLAPGLIIPFAGGTPPSGSLLCDGTSYVRDEYPLLAAEIDVIWGTTGNPLTFKVPDFRGRTLFGADGATLVLGQTDSQAAGSRGPLHRHTVTDPGHNHSYQRIVGGPANIAAGGDFTESGQNAGSKVTGITVGPPGQPLDGPAYAALLYVITTGQ